MAGAKKGNQNAVKDKIVTNALRRVIVQNPEKLRKACMKALDEAANGNIAYFKEIMDRMDGKPVQQIEGTGDNGEIPLSLAIRYVSSSKE